MHYFTKIANYEGLLRKIEIPRVTKLSVNDLLFMDMFKNPCGVVDIC